MQTTKQKSNILVFSQKNLDTCVKNSSDPKKGIF